MDAAKKAHILKRLYANFSPHPGQRQILSWIFKDNVKRLLAINGRNYGKTEIAIHMLARSILLRECLHKDILGDEIVDSYYVAPSITHARRIVWDNKRMEILVPREFILDVNKNDRMIYLTVDGKNCTGWIKVEGAENIWSLVGVKHKGVLAVDETYMIEKGFMDAHEEDLAAYEPPLLLFSTWPVEFPHWIDKLAKEYQNTPEWRFMNRPSMDNTELEKRNPGYFKKQRLRYELRGDLNGYKREILSERVISSGDHVFPSFNAQTYMEACNAGYQDEDTLVIKNPEAYVQIFEHGPKKPHEEHVFPHFQVAALVKKSQNELTPFIAVDPGHASRFATLFLAINSYTKEIFVLDEIYEGNRNLISTVTMLEQMVERAKGAFPWAQPEEIRKVCDEAALWFRMEANSVSQNPKGPTKGEIWAFVPTEKASYKQEFGYSMIKAAMNLQKFKVSDKCRWFIWEILNHRTDEKGKFPKKDDHALDCLRYALALGRYMVTEEDAIEEKEMFKEDEFNAQSLYREILEERSSNYDPWNFKDSEL